MHEYYAQYNAKVYYAITSHEAMENEATRPLALGDTMTFYKGAP